MIDLVSTFLRSNTHAFTLTKCSTKSTIVVAACTSEVSPRGACSILGGLENSLIVLETLIRGRGLGLLCIVLISRRGVRHQIIILL